MIQQQEVSAFEESNADDDWVLKCMRVLISGHTDSQKYWLREKPVRLLHASTKRYLSSSSKYQYRNPIPGQLEVWLVFTQVAGTLKVGAEESLVAQDGIYFARTDITDDQVVRDEL